VTLDRPPEPIRRWLYAGGTRQDRLRDPDAVIAALDLRPGMGLLSHWLGRHASSPRRVQREMAEAGYRLSATHDIVCSYWFGLFELSPR
jgi:hypothetical protein